MKTLATLAIAGVVATAAIATPKEAEAYWRGHRGGAVAAGVIGGLALGAIAAGAYRGGYYGGYGYAPGYASYGYEPAYYGAYAYGGPDCFIRRHRVWTNHGWIIRRVRVCN
jgi:hypothetical protein